MYKDLTPAEMAALAGLLLEGFNRATAVYYQDDKPPSASAHATWDELKRLVDSITIYVL